MSWSFCISGAAIVKAGAKQTPYANISGAIINTFSDQAEGRICAETRRNWLASWASISAGVLGYTLNEAASSLIANKIINYDMSGYTSRQEAQTMLDVNYDIYSEAIKFLKDFKSTEIKSL